MPSQTITRKMPLVMRLGFVLLTAALAILSCGLLYRLRELMEMTLP